MCGGLSVSQSNQDEANPAPSSWPLVYLQMPAYRICIDTKMRKQRATGAPGSAQLGIDFMQGSAQSFF
jgi:hypothetical protein